MAVCTGVDDAEKLKEAGPEAALLDEPTLGLDVQTARLVKILIVDLVKENNKTVLLSAHHMKIGRIGFRLQR